MFQTFIVASVYTRIQYKMAQNQNNNENQNESIFETETNENVKHITIQRMKEFCYYLTENVEKNLNFCLSLLEERTTSKKPNSDPITAISSVITPIPYIGKGISSALKEGEIYILNKIDQKNSRTLADLVFYFSDNKLSIRRMLIQSSSELFYCFEDQFMKLTCDGGPRRAMQKLAKDAANRIFTHFLENSQNTEISKDDFTKGAIFGSSIKNKFGMEAGRSLENNKEKTWKTSDIFTKVGLYFEDTDEYFKNEETKSDKYGYRRLFSWENLEEIREKWTTGNPSSVPNYNLSKNDLAAIFSEVERYIISKNVDEEARLDREKKHEEEMDDHQTKHEELIATFIERFEDVLDQISKNYEAIKTSRQESQRIVEIVQKEHNELGEKLIEIQCNVVVTKEGQKVLQETTEAMKSEICIIKTKQEELATSSQLQNVTPNELDEVKKVIKVINEVEKVTKAINETKKSLEKNGSEVERKVRKEVKRGLKKVFK